MEAFEMTIDGACGDSILLLLGLDSKALGEEVLGGEKSAIVGSEGGSNDGRQLRSCNIKLICIFLKVSNQFFTAFIIFSTVEKIELKLLERCNRKATQYE